MSALVNSHMRLDAVSTWLEEVPETLRMLVGSLHDQHPLRVSLLSAHLAGALGLNVREAVVCGFLHDVGKVCISRAILNKPGPLTEVEFEVVQRHVNEGASIVRKHWANVPLQILGGILDHHERLGGKGYPRRTNGPGALGAVVAVADVYDALTSARPYRAAYGASDAVRLLECEALPTDVIQALVTLLPNLLPADAMSVEVRGQLVATS